MGQGASIGRAKVHAESQRKSEYFGSFAVNEPGLLDNCILLLPAAAVELLKLQPNIEDKQQSKVLWFGRLWEIRQIQSERIASERKRQQLTRFSSRALKTLSKEFEKDARLHGILCKVQARWRGAVVRLRGSFHSLECLNIPTIKGCVVYMHGSGGMTVNNLRYARMLAGMGYLVIAPDSMACNKYRSREVDQSAFSRPDANTDYWASNLVYKSDATGALAYNTDVQQVLADPESHKVMYDSVFRERSAELAFTLSKLSSWMRHMGVTVMGTSEGAMTLARFDDRRHELFINGRIISSFSVEHTYFTPTREAAKFGGSLSIPTLNIIGTDDQYFGGKESVARVVAQAPGGYGDRNLTGNAFHTMRKQGMEQGLVCVLDGAKHDPTLTHDNFLRLLLEMFLARPHVCHRFHEIISLEHRSDCSILEQEQHQHLLKLHMSTPAYPASLSPRQVELLQLTRNGVSVHLDDLLQEAHAKMSSLMETASQEAGATRARCLQSLMLVQSI